MTTIQKDRILQHRGGDLLSRDGDKIGTIEEIYLDAETNEPEWALVHTGLFGTKQTFVPLREASEIDGALTIPVDKTTVKDAPKVEADGQLSQQKESELYRHYGLDYSADRDDAAGTAGRDTSGPTTDDAMTRSEEEVRVGTTRREAGRARLRKYVVTENVTETVPVQREEVRIEREPITDRNVDNALEGPEISEEEHEVTLHAEEPVVEKRTVPKERVRMDRDVVTDEQTVSEDVRKERIEADGDVDQRFRNEDDIARDRR
jgi:uncharacterized protein (TIGR02271 family)